MHEPSPALPLHPEYARRQQPRHDEFNRGQEDEDGRCDGQHEESSERHALAKIEQDGRYDEALPAYELQQGELGLVIEPAVEDGILGVPHGLDLGRIRPPQPIECPQRNVLISANGTNDLRIRLRVEGIQTRLGIGRRGERAVPVSLLRWLRPFWRGDVGERRPDMNTALGEGFGEIRRFELQQVLLRELVSFHRFGIFHGCLGCGSASWDCSEGVAMEMEMQAIIYVTCCYCCCCCCCCCCWCVLLEDVVALDGSKQGQK